MDSHAKIIKFNTKDNPMKKSLLRLSLVTVWLSAGNLSVTQGSVKAHTEVFGDSAIEPSTSGLNSHLKIANDPLSLNGSIDISMKGLKSDNTDRDEHMYEAINSMKFPQATYTITKVAQGAKSYKIDGILNFHGMKKPLSIDANIMQKGDNVHFSGKSSFLMSNYGVKPPKLLFLTVRDQVDLTIDVDFKNK